MWTDTGHKSIDWAIAFALQNGVTHSCQRALPSTARDDVPVLTDFSPQRMWICQAAGAAGLCRTPALTRSLSLSLFWRASSSAATALLAPFRVDTHGHTHTNETLGFGSRKASARLHRLTTSEPSGVPVKLFITVLAAHIPLVVVFFALGCQASPLFT